VLSQGQAKYRSVLSADEADHICAIKDGRYDYEERNGQFTHRLQTHNNGEETCPTSILFSAVTFHSDHQLQKKKNEKKIMTCHAADLGG
jgi:hypothetical protein